ncbi:Olfactory marker protein [Merluccius polli]|uniref:Olfactory marker protein n=1 Tax=Merluccius polli TaxID=89951 RepID=A0AA47NN18_MERPO|nr:Olfactory marker protein [Merluccius polli]
MHDSVMEGLLSMRRHAWRVTVRRVMSRLCGLRTSVPTMAAEDAGITSFLGQGGRYLDNGGEPVAELSDTFVRSPAADMSPLLLLSLLLCSLAPGGRTGGVDPSPPPRSPVERRDKVKEEEEEEDQEMLVSTLLVIRETVDRVLLEVTGVSRQGHLTHEGIHQQVMVVDLEETQERSVSTLWLWIQRRQKRYPSACYGYRSRGDRRESEHYCRSTVLARQPVGLVHMNHGDQVGGNVGEDPEQELSLQAGVEGRGDDDVAALLQVHAHEHAPGVDVHAARHLLLGHVHPVGELVVEAAPGAVGQRVVMATPGAAQHGLLPGLVEAQFLPLDGSGAAQATHQNSPSSCTVTPIRSLSLLLTFCHSSELQGPFHSRWPQGFLMRIMSSFSDLKKASRPWPRRTRRTSVTAVRLLAAALQEVHGLRHAPREIHQGVRRVAPVQRLRAPELVGVVGVAVHQLAVDGGQPVVHHHVHPVAEAPEAEVEDPGVGVGLLAVPLLVLPVRDHLDRDTSPFIHPSIHPSTSAPLHPDRQPSTAPLPGNMSSNTDPGSDKAPCAEAIRLSFTEDFSLTEVMRQRAASLQRSGQKRQDGERLLLPHEAVYRLDFRVQELAFGRWHVELTGRGRVTVTGISQLWTPDLTNLMTRQLLEPVGTFWRNAGDPLDSPLKCLEADMQEFGERIAEMAKVRKVMYFLIAYKEGAEPAMVSCSLEFVPE